MKTTIVTALLVLMTGVSASALEGYDGDNNPIPGHATQAPQSFSPAIYAQARAETRVQRDRAAFPKHEKLLFKRAQGLTD